MGFCRKASSNEDTVMLDTEIAALLLRSDALFMRNALICVMLGSRFSAASEEAAAGFCFIFARQQGSPFQMLGARPGGC